MADVTNGLRGAGSYSSGQRPTNYGKSIKTNTRITSEDVQKKLKGRKKPKWRKP